MEVVINPGRKYERRETRYFESDAAWFKRIRRELGTDKGRSPHWLVFNDEAHHAYRRGDGAADEENLNEDTALAKKNARRPYGSRARIASTSLREDESEALGCASRLTTTARMDKEDASGLAGEPAG